MQGLFEGPFIPYTSSSWGAPSKYTIQIVFALNTSEHEFGIAETSCAWNAIKTCSPARLQVFAHVARASLSDMVAIKCRCLRPQKKITAHLGVNAATAAHCSQSSQALEI